MPRALNLLEYLEATMTSPDDLVEQEPTQNYYDPESDLLGGIDPVTGRLIRQARQTRQAQPQQFSPPIYAPGHDPSRPASPENPLLQEWSDDRLANELNKFMPFGAEAPPEPKEE